MIRHLRLRNFRGFEKYDLNLREAALLIGPNNAGKSTLIGALRSVDLMLRHARARNPSDQFRDDGSWRSGYPITPRLFALDEESLRFNSISAETRLEVDFSDKRSVHAVWPSDGSPGFFYLIHGEGQVPRSPADVRKHFPLYGVIPPLSPVEKEEPLLDWKTVRENLNTRRASRNFRNQLYFLAHPEKGEPETFRAFLQYATSWLPELRLEAPEFVHEANPSRIDVVYWEGEQVRELAWAGDGVQVFLQLLYHCFRLQGSESIVLDEPEVYLHADLQRRLFRVIERLGSQYIIATHSAEVATEAPPVATIWVDRRRKKGVLASSAPDLEELTAALGLQFNLRLARALRTKTVVFVEGEDWKFLRNLARQLGLEDFVRERELTVIPIRGSDNWKRLEGFSWLFEVFLEQAVTGWLLLDRDFKSDEYMQHVISKLSTPMLSVRFWQRHEIENYLLEPELIARASATSTTFVDRALSEITAAMREKVLLDIMGTWEAEPCTLDRRVPALSASCTAALNVWWESPTDRLKRCPGKEIFTRLNEQLQSSGLKAVSPLGLSGSIRKSEIDPEVGEVLRGVMANSW